jgi:adenine-specific DNA methylase
LEEARKALEGTKGTSVNVPSEAKAHWDYAKPENVRAGLLDFIAEFANWDNSTNKDYLDLARHLVQVAHESLGGAPGTRPLVFDPFAGGAAIPLEALRVGADAFASDLNPVAVLLNKVVLEYIPKYGHRLADEVRKLGSWIQERAEKRLEGYYPKDTDGSIPIAYLWARTIRCEGPACGAIVPMLRSLWLTTKTGKPVALQLTPHRDEKRVAISIVQEAKAKDVKPGTVQRGSVTCPHCGYTTPVVSVRKQLKLRRGGTNDAQLLCVVTTRRDRTGRSYRTASAADVMAVEAARSELTRLCREHVGAYTFLPDELISLNEIRRISVPIYGMERWSDLFTSRQSLALATLGGLIKEAARKLSEHGDSEFAIAVQTCLALAVNRLADRGSSLCRWDPTPTASGIINTFSRQAIPMMWDFAEGNPLEQKSGGWLPTLEWIALVVENGFKVIQTAYVEKASATRVPLPDDSVDALVTDPPYYDAVPYAHLSDFFYVQLKRSVSNCHPDLFTPEHVPKSEEIVVDRPHELSTSQKNIAFYERELTNAFLEARRITRPSGICWA